MTRPETDGGSGAANVAVLIVASLVALFTVAMMAGMIAAASDHDGPHSAAFYAVFAVTLAVAAGALWTVYRNRTALALPASPRMRKSRILLYICLAVGLVVGMGLALADGQDAADLGALISPSAPISPAVALALFAALMVSIALSLRWHMLLDEHERAAYDFGAVAALYVYFMVSMGWWLLARGGFVPAPNGYVIFWLVTFVWAVGWLVRRYR